MMTNFTKEIGLSAQVTDFFEGGARKREEILAQPECGVCGSQCMDICLQPGACGIDPSTINTSAAEVRNDDTIDAQPTGGGG